MSHRREQVNIDAEAPQEKYTLEAILSEYKSEAYINSERRLSKGHLEEQAQAIIDEMKRRVELELSGDTELTQDTAAEQEAQYTEPEKIPENDAEPTETEQNAVEEMQEEQPEPIADEQKSEAEAPVADEPEENTQTVSKNTASVLTQQVETDDPQTEIAHREEEAANGEERAEKAIKRARRVRKRRAEAEKAHSAKESGERDKDKKNEVKPKEPSLTEAMHRYAANIASLRRRTALAMLIAILSALAALFFRSAAAQAMSMQRMCLAMLIAQLVVMFLGADVLISGVLNLFRGRPRSGALAVLSCAASIADAVSIYIGAAENVGLPFCAAASMSLAFEMYSERAGRSAYRTVFKTAKAAKLPTVVTAESGQDGKGALLNKRLGTAAGFVLRTMEPGYYERAVSKLCPLLMVATVVLSAAAAVRGGGQFCHSLAAAAAVSATFTLPGVFSVPFNRISGNLAGHGAAIAGWSGAEELNSAEGIIIRDNDVFPENTVTLNGVKVFSGASAEKTISYTGSLIIASGCGLARLFGELLREYSASIYHVEEFLCYEGGGVGANIGGDRVLVGSAAFMKLMGISLPTNVDAAGAVYSAVNGVAAGVFVVNYEPVVMVQNSLVSLMQSNMRPVFALRDFNITPAMLAAKYKISSDNMEFPSLEDRYAMSSEYDDGEKRIPAALMSREGLGHFAQLYKCGARLIKAVKRGFAMTAAGAALGLLTVTYALANGAYSSASVANVIIYSALWALAIRLIADRGDGK